MKVSLKGHYKALKDFEVIFNQGLTLITGFNGAGKSQLLQLINSKFGGQLSHGQYYTPRHIDSQFDLKIESRSSISKEDVIFWSDAYGQTTFANPIKYSDFKEVCLELYCILNPEKRNQISQQIGTKRNNPSDKSIITKGTLKSLISVISDELIDEIVRSSGKEKKKILPADIFGHFPVSTLVEKLPNNQTDAVFSFYFYCHQYKIAYTKKKGVEPPKEKAPWEVLQEVIDSLGFSYKVFEPDISKIEEIIEFELNEVSEVAYKISLFDTSINKEINFTDLSSGEKQLFSIGMLRYSTETRGKSRKLVLLDEPDAHLHPLMIPQFFQIVCDYLVKKNGMKVIMTTHSASTITISSNYDDLDLFFMKRSSEYESTSFEKDVSPYFSKSIKTLSNGLISIFPETKFVVVEDNDDVEFYDLINSFSNNPKSSVLNFIPSSRLTLNGEGGKDAVKKSLELLGNFDAITHNNTSVVGLIDRDLGNEEYEENTLINLIHRYSIENYWFDPLIVYCALVNGKSNEEFEKIDILKIRPGEEFKLRDIPNEDVQDQVNVLLKELESNIDFIENEEVLEFNSSTKKLKSSVSLKEKVMVQHINGHRIEIPKWLIDVRGKDLRQVYQAKFNNLRSLSKETSFKHIRSTKHIPIELLETIENCVQHGV